MGAGEIVAGKPPQIESSFMLESLDRLRRFHPVPVGAAEALVAGAALVFLRGVAGGMLGHAAWSVLMWAALAFRRPASYQVTALIVLAAMTDVMSSNRLGESLGPMAAAMIAGNIWATTADRRWEPPHAVFTVVGFLAATAFGVVAGLLGPRLFGPVPGISVFVSTLGTIALAVGAVFLLGVVRGRMADRSTRRSRSVRGAR